jgi:GxxExxY protein
MQRKANVEDPLTKRILAAAIAVHRELGPGFLESIYEEALAIAFAEAGLVAERQKIIPVFYREHIVGEHRLDFLVDRTVVVELKATSAFDARHFAVVRSYLTAARCEVGLLLNFATPTLAIKRIGRNYNPNPGDADLLA